MTDDRHDLEQARALIALRVSLPEDAALGEPVTDEELALLVEDRLVFQRKQEALKQILHDDQLLRRWLSLSEAVLGLAEPSVAGNDQLESQSAPTLQRWWAFWQTWLLGGASGAVALMFGLYIGIDLLQLPADDSRDPDTVVRGLGGDGQETTHIAERDPSMTLPSLCAAATIRGPGLNPSIAENLEQNPSQQDGHVCFTQWRTAQAQIMGLWLWVTEDALPQQLALGSLADTAEALLVSADNNWLVMAFENDGARELRFYALADWFTAEAESIPNVITTVPDLKPGALSSIQWRDGMLWFDSYYDFETGQASAQLRSWFVDPEDGNVFRKPASE